jgi:hypothetical protein
MLLLAKDLYNLLKLCLRCYFLLNLLLHDLSSLYDHPSSSHTFLYQAKTFVFSVKARQFIFNDTFNFFLEILLHIFLALICCCTSYG